MLLKIIPEKEMKLAVNIKRKEVTTLEAVPTAVGN